MRSNWIVQLVILGITVLVFRRALEETGPAIAIVIGAATFLVPTIIWARIRPKDSD